MTTDIPAALILSDLEKRALLWACGLSGADELDSNDLALEPVFDRLDALGLVRIADFIDVDEPGMYVGATNTRLRPQPAVRNGAAAFFALRTQLNVAGASAFPRFQRQFMSRLARPK